MKILQRIRKRNSRKFPHGVLDVISEKNSEEILESYSVEDILQEQLVEIQESFKIINKELKKPRNIETSDSNR